MVGSPYFVTCRPHYYCVDLSLQYYLDLPGEKTNSRDLLLKLYFKETISIGQKPIMFTFLESTMILIQTEMQSLTNKKD